MEYLLANAQFVADSNVIELGAGTGITGMLCKKLGCTNAYITDHDSRSINHMILDVARNDIDCKVVPLDWFQYSEDETLQLLQSGQCTEEGAEGGSSMGPPLRIVAGDVLYKDALITPFFTVISSLLSVCEGSEMLLCHVPRAGVEQQQVVAVCGQYGLAVRRVAHGEWKKGIVIEYSTADDYDRAELYVITKDKISK